MVENVKHKGLALLVLAGAQFMVILDASIVNVALPSIQKALDFTSTAQLQWIVTAYTLLFGGFLLLGGRLADLVGRRRIFITGMVLFALASLFAGLSSNPTELITLRAIQGLGAALLSPSALSLVLSIFSEGKERNRALGVWSGVAAGGGAAGLLLGGILTEYINWRWIFFINVPVAIFLTFMAFRNVPPVRSDRKGTSLDLPGAFLVTAGLMILVYGLVKAGTSGWGSHSTIGFLAAAVVLLPSFIFNEFHVRQPLMQLGIFRNRNVAAGNLMQLPITAGMFSVFFYLSLYEQIILHFTPVTTGFANLPFTICIGILAAITSRKIARVAPRSILMISPLIVASGLFYFSRLPVHGHYLTDILPGIVLMASGMGATFVALTLAATSGVPAKDSGLVSGLLNTSQQIGGAIGLAVLSSISTAVTSHYLKVHPLTHAGLPVDALVRGFHSAFRIAACLAIAASSIAIIGLSRNKMAHEDVDHEMEHEAEGFPVVPGV